MKPFSYGRNPVRVLIGAGVATLLGPELQRIGANRVLIVTTNGRSADASRIAASLGNRIVGEFTGARRHVPVDIVNVALDAMRTTRADACMSVGGGSAIGLAKAIALETGAPIIAVPTTYSGSEMTSIWGVTDGGVKSTGRDDRVAARIVACDPALTLDLPADTSAQSGLNAIAHAVEALYAVDANPIASLFAREAIRLLAQSLRRIVTSPRDEAARAEALIGGHLAGRALEMVSMGLHHRLCHIIGGMFDTPHALTHAVLLPQVVAFKAMHEEPVEVWGQIRAAIDGSADHEATTAETGPLHQAVEVQARPDRRNPKLARESADAGLDAARSIHRLNLQLGITQNLQVLGLSRTDLDRVADAAAVSAGLSQAVLRDGLRALLERAWRGLPPGSPTE